MPKREWEYFPELPHLHGEVRKAMEIRRRLRTVRYVLFRLQTQTEKGEPLVASTMPPGFIEFWLGEKPRYSVDPRGRKTHVPVHKNLFITDLGGYASFAKVWDIDSDLFVYLRHRSIWHEWATKLQQVVPVLGDE
jgi:hypothetical protein